MKTKRAWLVAIPLFAVLLLSVLLMSEARAATTPDGYVYSVLAGKATITGYEGELTTLSIPSTAGGYPVTAIGDDAFYDRYDLTRNFQS